MYIYLWKLSDRTYVADCPARDRSSFCSRSAAEMFASSAAGDCRGLTAAQVQTSACCSVLQCVAVYCSVLQCVAVCNQEQH